MVIGPGNHALHNNLPPLPAVQDSLLAELLCLSHITHPSIPGPAHMSSGLKLDNTYTIYFSIYLLLFNIHDTFFTQSKCNRSSRSIVQLYTSFVTFSIFKKSKDILKTEKHAYSCNSIIL